MSVAFADDARATRQPRRHHHRATRRSSRPLPLLAAALFALCASCARALNVPKYVAPPYLQRLEPPKGHVVGGTTVRIYGGGFARNANLAVRFAYYDSSTSTAEVDVVSATFIDFATIEVVTPPRATASVVHLTVTNNGVGYSAMPLNTDDQGTYLTFTYVATAPLGTWYLRNATGHSTGGAVVEIENRAQNSMNLLTDANFLPGVHLRCRFGNPSDQSSQTTINVGEETKTSEHPWFGRGSLDGYKLTGNRVAGQGQTLVLERGITYTFQFTLTKHPFVLTTVEPSRWHESILRENYLPLASGVLPTTSTITFTPSASTPNTIFYTSTKDPFVGGMIIVIDSGATTPFQTGAAEANTVRAEWISYSKIRCVAPAWDGSTDDDSDHGGAQVTVFVSNDGYSYASGQGGADAATPADAGAATTFTYYDDNAFNDIPVYYSASGTTYQDGVALSFGSKYVYSSIYADDGSKDSALATAYTNAATAHATEAAATSGSVVANNLVVEGTYAGVGLGWYEVVLDRDSSSSGGETYRWRFHTEIGSNVDWADTFQAIPVGVNSGSAATLSNGITIRFTSAGAHHVLGDRWLIRVYGGGPNVVAASTTHDDTTYPARGPFTGNTEITLTGQAFFASSAMKCKLHDSDTGVTQTLEAFFDNSKRLRCITNAHEERSGGEVIGTFRPCVKKTIQVTINNGVTWTATKSGLDFLFCDIYVSKDGSDTYGSGTPNDPFLTIQRAIESALGEPRSYDIHYELNNPNTAIRGASQYRVSSFGKTSKVPINKGYGYYVNRDRIRISTGTYAGAGNIGIHPLGKMLEAVAKDGTVVIDCGDQGYSGVLVSGDRHGREEVTNSGSISFMNVIHNNCK